MGLLVVEDADIGGDLPAPRRAFAVDQVANRPIAHHVLDVLESAGVQDVVVASSAEQAGIVRDCLDGWVHARGLRLKYIERARPLDLPGALILAAPLIGAAPCIVHLASGLLGEPLTPLLDCMPRDRPHVAMFTQRRPAPARRLSDAAQQMLHIAELRPKVACPGVAGVWLFGRGALRCFAHAGWNERTGVDLTKIAEPIASVQGKLHAVAVDGWCRYAGDPADLLELNRTVLDRLQCDGRRPDDAGNRIEGRVQIDERAFVRASVIVGPAVIGAGARVTDAYIGPYTSIGPHARIDGAEIERSIVGAGASITHAGGRLIASVIGRDARIFRDFSLPRALRLRIGDGTEVALC